MRLFIVLLCFSAVFSHAQSPKIEGLSKPTQISFLQEIIHEINQELPQGFKLSSPIKLEIKSLNKTLDRSHFCESSGKTLGIYTKRNNKIRISSKLFQLAFSQNNSAGDIDCFHRTFRKTLKATIIHEYAHHIDRSLKISRKKDFKKLIGGIKRGFMSLFNRNKVKNSNHENSPDPYEFKNSKESFAVNFEYYILDPLYRCAKPAITHYYDQYFGSKEVNCKNFKSILVHSNDSDDNLSQAVNLDMERVYAVHYLHADKGPQIMSKWGHSMFRVIVCAPERKQKSEKCLDDLAHHVVLSYRANVPDFAINHIKGLLGSYPSQLFIYSYPEIIKEYTRLEFRNLYSIPLELDKKDLKYFIDISLERYWNYKGRYFFLTNNCGTETINQIRSMDNKRSKKIKSLTPKKLFKTLKKSQLVNKDTYNTILKSEVNNRYFVKSKLESYHDAFKTVNSYNIFEGTFEDVLKKSNAEKRMKKYELLLKSERFVNQDKKKRSKVILEMIYIERYFQIFEKKEIANSVLKVMVKDKESPFFKEIQKDLKEIYSFPWEIVENNYGIANVDAINQYLEKKKEKRSQSTELVNKIRSSKEISPLLDKLDNLHKIEATLLKHLIQG